MEPNDSAALRQQIRTHLNVFLLLAGLIGLNVGVTFLPGGGGVRTGVQVALAALSGGLVITFFMHLLSERATTWLILAITFILFAVLLTLTLVAHADHPKLTEYHHLNRSPAVPAPSHVP